MKLYFGVATPSALLFKLFAPFPQFASLKIEGWLRLWHVLYFNECSRSKKSTTIHRDGGAGELVARAHGRTEGIDRGGLRHTICPKNNYYPLPENVCYINIINHAGSRNRYGRYGSCRTNNSDSAYFLLVCNFVLYRIIQIYTLYQSILYE